MLNRLQTTLLSLKYPFLVSLWCLMLNIYYCYWHVCSLNCLPGLSITLAKTSASGQPHRKLWWLSSLAPFIISFMKKNNPCIRLLFHLSILYLFLFLNLHFPLCFSPTCIGSFSLYVPLILSSSLLISPWGARARELNCPPLSGHHTQIFLFSLVFPSPLHISGIGRDQAFSRGAQLAVQSAVNPGLLVPPVVPHSVWNWNGPTAPAQ